MGSRNFSANCILCSRFAIALGVSAAKVTANFLLGGAAFLMANDHDLALANSPKTAHDGRVITKLAIPCNSRKSRQIILM